MNKLPALVIALLLAAAANALIEPFNHPPSCDACHSNPAANQSSSLSGLTMGPAAGSCDPSKQECVWSHEVLTGVNVWKACENCHVAIANSIKGGPGSVHASLQNDYGCACHAVAHVGYGDSAKNIPYAACIYFYVPKLSDTGVIAADKYRGLTLQSEKLCFKGLPGGTYDIDNTYSTWTLPSGITQINAVYLNISYVTYPNGTVIARSFLQGMPAEKVEIDFFSLLEQNPIFRYEYGTAYGGVLKSTTARTHPLTEEAPTGETIIMGLFDIHDAKFLLAVPYFPYSRYPYYIPVGVNIPMTACFNCHFVYEGQTGTAKVMNIGGVWKIGIPADVLNSVTDPHNIALPKAAESAGIVPNLSLVALIATATLLGGAFAIVKRRL